MRIDAIRNCRMAYSAPKTSSSHSLPKKNETQPNVLNQDTVSFKSSPKYSHAVELGAKSTAFGLLTFAALSAVSGLAIPASACALYAAVFGTAGTVAGMVRDNAEENSEVKIA